MTNMKKRKKCARLHKIGGGRRTLIVQFIIIMIIMVLMAGGFESLLFGSVDGVDMPNNQGIISNYFE